MEQNKVELIGRINYKEIKEHKTCKIVKFSVGKQIREKEWVSFWLTMFNEEGEKAYKLFEKGDYGYFTGKLSVNTYVKNEKPVNSLEFLAYDAKKVKYDTDKKEYVEVVPEGLDDWE